MGWWLKSLQNRVAVTVGGGPTPKEPTTFIPPPICGIAGDNIGGVEICKQSQAGVNEPRHAPLDLVGDVRLEMVHCASKFATSNQG